MRTLVETVETAHTPESLGAALHGEPGRVVLRTAMFEVASARYSIVPDRFYRPDLESVRKQSKSNRQGGDEPIDVGTAEEFMKLLAEALATKWRAAQGDRASDRGMHMH